MLRTMESERHRLLLLREIDRLRMERYSFQGENLEKQLGCDAWVLGVAVVEGKPTRERREKL